MAFTAKVDAAVTAVSTYKNERDAFSKDPDATIKRWKAALSEDLAAGKTISECRIMKTFSSMTQEERNRVGRYLAENYNIELASPANKVACLARWKDSLEKVVENYDPQHLFILVYSKGARVAGKKPIAAEKSKCKADARDTPLEDFHKRKIGNGEEEIVFYVEKNISSQVEEGRLERIQEMIVELNRFIPHLPSKEIYIKENIYSHFMTALNITVDNIDDNMESDYVEPLNPRGILSMNFRPHKEPGTDGVFFANGREVNQDPRSPEIKMEFIKKIRIGLDTLNHSRYLGVAAHEQGHLMHLALNIKNDKEWGKIFALSLKNANYEIVDDNNYENVIDMYGHPYDSDNELFASAINAYVIHPEQFAANINDPDTPESMRETGRLIWCYLRDNVFQGKVYSKKDPFGRFQYADYYRWVIGKSSKRSV